MAFWATSPGHHQRQHASPGAAGNLKLPPPTADRRGHGLARRRDNRFRSTRSTASIELDLPDNADAKVLREHVNGSITSEFPSLISGETIPHWQHLERQSWQRQCNRACRRRQWHHQNPETRETIANSGRHVGGLGPFGDCVHQTRCQANQGDYQMERRGRCRPAWISLSPHEAVAFYICKEQTDNTNFPGPFLDPFCT